MEIATTFFKNLFQSQGVTDTKEILDAVVPSVSDEMNVILTLSYTKEEIVYAIKYAPY